MRMIHSRKPPKPIQPDSTGPAMGIQNTKRLHASRKRLSTKDCAALFPYKFILFFNGQK